MSKLVLNQAVVVAHPETGALVSYKTGEKGEFGTIRVDCKSLSISNGFQRINTRSAFIRMEADQARAIESLLADGQPYPLEGKIVVRESTTPFYDGQEPKMNPETQKVITSGGAPVYRETDFVTTDEQDVLIASDKVEAGVPATQGAE